jgi:putative transposase
MRTQCQVLGVARSSLDYVPAEETTLNAQIKRQLDELYLREPCLGSRKLVTVLARDHGIEVNRKRVQRLRLEMGLEAIYCKPRTSIANKADRHPSLPAA